MLISLECYFTNRSIGGVGLLQGDGVAAEEPSTRRCPTPSPSSGTLPGYQAAAGGHCLLNSCSERSR